VEYELQTYLEPSYGKNSSKLEYNTDKHMNHDRCVFTLTLNPP
jgi:hypothetical protein